MTETETRASPAAAEPCLADDLLRGADEIAEFVFGDARQRRKIYHLCETKALPIFKLSGIVCARRSTLRKHFEKLEGGAN